MGGLIKDANGNEIQIGDAILIPATVSAFDGDGMLKAKLAHHTPKNPKDQLEYRFEASHVQIVSDEKAEEAAPETPATPAPEANEAAQESSPGPAADAT